MSAVEHAHHIPGCAALQLELFDALAALSVASASSAAASVAASVSASSLCALLCWVLQQRHDAVRCSSALPDTFLEPLRADRQRAATLA